MLSIANEVDLSFFFYACVLYAIQTMFFQQNLDLGEVFGLTQKGSPVRGRSTRELLAVKP